MSFFSKLKQSKQIFTQVINFSLERSMVKQKSIDSCFRRNDTFGRDSANYLLESHS